MPIATGSSAATTVRVHSTSELTTATSTQTNLDLSENEALDSFTINNPEMWVDLSPRHLREVIGSGFFEEEDDESCSDSASNPSDSDDGHGTDTDTDASTYFSGEDSDDDNDDDNDDNKKNINVDNNAWKKPPPHLPKSRESFDSADGVISDTTSFSFSSSSLSSSSSSYSPAFFFFSSPPPLSSSSSLSLASPLAMMTRDPSKVASPSSGSNSNSAGRAGAERP